jgi:hypothetical protein
MNNMNKRTFLSLLLCVCCLSFLHAERVDMQQAGADVQGRKLNTALINSTIDRLNAHGGGTLFFPAGTYLTGSIHMKSCRDSGSPQRGASSADSATGKDHGAL